MNAQDRGLANIYASGMHDVSYS